MIVESAMKQKLRVKSLNLGDASNTYFLAHIKGRIAQNTVTSLMTSEGTRI